MPIVDPARAPCVSLIDDEYKLVMSRLGERMRIAGTAELNGYNTELNEAALPRDPRDATEQLFPGAVDDSRPKFWTGLRPATPSNVPLIGRTRYPEPLSQHRARHARLDAFVRVGPRDRGHRERARAGGRFRVHQTVACVSNSPAGARGALSTRPYPQGADFRS